jgi:hypothetical protein
MIKNKKNTKSKKKIQKKKDLSKFISGQHHTAGCENFNGI